MGRKKDQIWYHVEKLNDKVFKCKYCGEEFTGGALRVKAHLFGIEGKGIRTCTGVPKDAQTVASSTFADSNKIPCSNVNACNAQQNIVNSNTRNDSSGGKSVPIHADVPENVQRASFSTMNDSNQSIMMNVNSSFLEVNSHNFNQSVMRNLDSSYFEMNCLNFNQTIIENVDSGDPNLISNQSITTNTNASDLSKGKLVTVIHQKEILNFIQCRQRQIL
ncbi:hypothetical protein L6164_002295 [Bauhinia variegata]|uniref:Uncharacterized protein n=3 Tax=Bauhinia variegata TaxID=167791 RepID=A0ACB9PY91_BAUVA|nr:hypothetical protein L6164_002285 [Bauhinia variegata]KAI4353330.1 hypothetical protein L6164_002289 [Bauhinia variegata]KAI4353336.1 hypothetical protein L6164_002295 [Bauhinia variegata]